MPNPLQRTPTERELERASMSQSVITELGIASLHTTSEKQDELKALAGRIYLCNHPSNNWRVSQAYDNDDREPSDAVGRFWRCNSKLCQSCLARQSRLTRRKVNEAISFQTPKSNEKYYFLTFTIPNPDLTLLETRSIVNYAWSLFRKRSLCVALIRGGVKSEEFTVTKHGFHYHLHVLVLSKWLYYQAIRSIWTECVEKSFEQHERPFECNNADGMLSVKIKPIVPSFRAVNEVCKYITKCDSWSKIKRSDLIEVALIRRWCRMFELFGSFRESENPNREAVQPIVHTRSLSDGSSEPSHKYWRDQLLKISVDIYLLNLEAELDRQREFGMNELRKTYPGKTITTFDYL